MPPALLGWWPIQRLGIADQPEACAAMLTNPLPAQSLRRGIGDSVETGRRWRSVDGLQACGDDLVGPHHAQAMAGQQVSAPLRRAAPASSRDAVAALRPLGSRPHEIPAGRAPG
jgi:hypothetical protein